MEFMQKVKLGITAAVTIVVLIIVFQNLEQVPVTILFKTLSLPLFVLLLLTLAVGFALGWLTSVFLRRRKAKEVMV